MRTKKFILLSILLVFLIASVSAAAVNLHLQVKNSQSPNAPISEADVKVWRGTTLYQRTTDSNGEIQISTNLNPGTYYFDINITKSGFVKKSYYNLPVTISYSSQGHPNYYLILPATLAPEICNNNGTCDSGETLENCADCTLSSGIVKNVQLITATLPQTDVQCPANHATEGSFYGTGSYQLYLSKLCVEYVSPVRFTAGNYYEDVYLYSKGSTENNCEEHEGQEDDVRGTFYGGSWFNLCGRTAQVDDLTEDQFVGDVMISDSGACSVNYDEKTGPFRDSNGVNRVLCTDLAIDESSSGRCTLSEKPTWRKSNPLDIQTEVFGWVGSITKDSDGKCNVDYGTYEYQAGIGDLVLYANAAGCEKETLKFEIFGLNELNSNPSTGYSIYSTTISPDFQRVGDFTFLSWCPPWSPPGIGPEAPKYYNFKVSVQGSSPIVESPFSDTLKVKKPEGAECNYRDGDEDDAECEALGKTGFICVEGNICADFSCTKDTDCDAGFCNLQTKKCVECYNDEHCTTSTTFGEGWKCGTDSAILDKFQKCYNPNPCKLTGLTWKKASGNEVASVVKGHINTEDWTCGDIINLEAAATGDCEGEEVAFVIIEKKGFIDFLKVAPDEEGNFDWEDIENAMKGFKGLVRTATPIANYKRFYFNGFEPPWDVDLENFLSDGGKFEYQFYAISTKSGAVLTGLNAEGKVDTSVPAHPILTVKKPDEAQCHYDESDSGEDDAECKDEGKRCDKCNKCVKKCVEDSECEEGQLCAKEAKNGEPATPGTPGICYECFSDTQCADNEGKKYCTPADSPTPFTCVECRTKEQCSLSANDNLVVCSNNACTSTCNLTRVPGDPNADCLIFHDGLNQDQINALKPAERAAIKGKTVCEPEKKECVQCSLNYPLCQKDTYCLQEKNECVECFENENCGFGRHCNLDEHICEGGSGDIGLGGGGAAGIIVTIIGSIAGFLILGPQGIILGPMLNSLFGGGSGGEGGGGMDWLSQLLPMIMGFFKNMLALL